MKITICYDNTSLYPHLIPDWGFSCFIEFEGRKILFDTGGNGRILLQNMRALGLDPVSMDDIFISHPDFDHIGGLSHVLNLNSTAVVHNPFSFRGVRYPNQVRYYDQPAQIYDRVFTTGELNRVEQSLGIETDKGLVVVIGCAHPGVTQIMEAFSGPFHPTSSVILAVVGGLHGFDEFEALEHVAKVCPTHCTRYLDKIKHLYPDKYIQGGVGAVIEF